MTIGARTNMTELFFEREAINFGDLPDERMREEGIGVQVNYLPVYWHPVYADLGYRRGMCPNAEAFYNKVLQFPKSPIYPYALYKAAWCRFNQSAFADAMKLFRRVVEVSEKEVVRDYGAFRDLQRHRLLTIEWQPLTPNHGYVRPDLVDEAGMTDVFDDAMARSAALYDMLKDEFPQQASYAVSMAYRLRYSMQFNAREAIHMLELRSSPQGHPAYRQVAGLRQDA